MPSLAELLKASGIEDEVINGLPAKVVEVTTGFIASAEKEKSDATELRRLAAAEKAEIDAYVEKYSNSLTEQASLRASLEAQSTYLKKLKGEGFEVPDSIMAPASAPAAVPGSPAMGGNVDEKKIYSNVGTFVAQAIDASNEYFRVYGQPMPDSIETIASEAQSHRMSPGDWAARKYEFQKKREEKTAADRSKEIDTAKTQAVEEFKRKQAEAMGSNPALVQGGTSRNSMVPKIVKEEFHKSDGNIPIRERRSRLLDNIHRDVAASRST